MVKLNRVTLISIDCYNYGGAVAALKKSMEQCKFASVKFLTDIPIKIKDIDVIQIPSIKSKEQYSEFCIKELYKYFDTDFVLICQHDGYVINGDMWDDNFYNYDVLGAAWLYIDNKNNSNGGFCIRSKRLQTILGTDNFIEASDPEDQAIGRLYRDYLVKKYNIKFPDDDTCDKFAFELRTPIYDTFGFHGNFHAPFMPTIVIKRSAALGDVVATEPVMRYFHDKGYRVVLDTLPQFHLLFLNHYFKVHRLDQIDQRLLETAKFVNLDMSYESNPKQLHLKSYFEFAGVPEEEYLPYLVTPKLSVGFPLTKETKLFEKYVVLHVDNRPVEQGRNIKGFDWVFIVEYLKKLGYTVIQLGKDDTAVIPNATRLNCTNENFLCYVCGGADLMIGIDSGISNICSAFNVPCVILSGSVDIRYIHPDMSNKVWVHNHDSKPCNTPFCWHNEITTNIKCSVNSSSPPCTQFTLDDIYYAINKILKLDNDKN